MNAQLQSVTTASPDSLRAVFDRLKAARHNRPAPSLAERDALLARLREVFQRRLPEMYAAISEDFGLRTHVESAISDGWVVLQAIDQARAEMRRWSKTQRRSAGLMLFPASAEMRAHPVGVVGIMAPWNYPVNLALMPLASAIAAGNSVYVRPSEQSPRTSAFVASLLAEALPADRVAVATGGPEVSIAFAALPFDHLLFTGSTGVGRKIMAAAAANLTPVTLELGGKSPAIIGPDYPLAKAAARILTGKMFNSGQSCNAPDYVFVPRARRDAFIAELRREMAERYPDQHAFAAVTRVIHAASYRRLRGYLDDARAKGAQLLPLLDLDASRAEAERLLPLTVLLDVNDDMRVMQEEIFGPILPILCYDTLEDAIGYVNAHDRPLGLYVFDHERAHVEQVLSRCIAGGACVNDTMLQFTAKELPFGGSGASGIGWVHGREGFETFTKWTPVLRQSRFTALDWLLKPPYGRITDALVKFLTR